MFIINPYIFGVDYTIENALVLDGANDYLNLTIPAGGNTKTFTIFGYFKRSKLGTSQSLFCSETANADQLQLIFTSDDKINLIYKDQSDTGTNDWTTTQVFRDTSAWYFFAWTINTVPSTPIFKFWIWNTEITAFTKTTDTLAQDDVSSWNFNATNSQVGIGCRLRIGSSPNEFFNGYIAHLGNLDGTVITDPVTNNLIEVNDDGIPIPKNVKSLDYGDAGWLLDFAVAPGTSNGAGTDVSGETNHFTENSSLVAADQVEDSPTDDADNNIGNYATLNPVAEGNNSSNLVTYTQGNTIATQPGSHGCMVYGSIGVSSGKWVWEVDVLVANAGYVASNGIGIASVTSKEITNAADTPWNSTYANGYCYKLDGDKNVLGTDSSYGATYNASNLIRVELNLDDDEVTFFKDNASQGAISITTGLTWFPAWYQYLAGDSVQFKFIDLTNTPTSGFLKLNTANLPDPAIADPDDHFFSKVVTHGGTSTATTCTFNLATNEWLMIIKNVESSENWYVVDSIRGVAFYSDFNSNAPVQINDTNVVTVSGTTFTLGSTLAAEDYIVDIHKAGLTSATAAVTTGSINTVKTSANTTSGFFISTYTGTGSAGTIAHGLTEAPDVVITRSISGSSNTGWYTYHNANTERSSNVDQSDPAHKYLSIAVIDGNYDESTAWNDTNPTSSVFSVGTHGSTNADGLSYVSYGWHSVSGYSSFGLYTGNGNADGPMITLDFTPNTLMTKMTLDGTADNSAEWAWWNRQWADVPNANPDDYHILPSAAAAGVTAGQDLDFLSNGIKIRDTDDIVNGDTHKYIYFAWGGIPLKTGNAR